MIKAISTVAWEEALRGFILHKEAVRSLKTAKWYGFYCANLVNWANEHDISLDEFTKRHLDEFLVYRAHLGRSATTLHHDALCATVFTEWCKSNGLVDRDPLLDVKVRNAPKTHKYMPTLENVQRLLQAVLDFYDLKKNPEAKYLAASKRSFNRDLNCAMILTLLDSACRIGEVLSLKLEDYQPSQKQITVRVAKGREPRAIPVSRDCAEAISVWRKVLLTVSALGWLAQRRTRQQGNVRPLAKVERTEGLPLRKASDACYTEPGHDAAPPGQLILPAYPQTGSRYMGSPSFSANDEL